MSGSKVLLDTNIVSALLDQEAVILAKLGTVRVIVPNVVLGELYYGVYASSRVDANLRRLDSLRAGMVLLHADEDTARHYGLIRAQLKRKGRPIPENDVWIAALALQYDLPLITRDRHFSEIDGLRLEAW